VEETNSPQSAETRELGKDDGASGDKKSGSRSERVKAIGGLIAVAIGVVAVGVIALAAISKNSEIAATIASAAGGVIATIVGAYFGVKVGTDQAKTVLDGQQKEIADTKKSQKAEAAKAQVYAMHLPSDNAETIIGLAEKAAQDALNR